MMYRTLATTTVLALFSGAAANAAMLAEYNFNDETLTNSAATPPDLDVTDLSLVGVGNTNFSGIFEFGDQLTFSANTPASDFSAAISGATSYVSFTITPQNGSVWNLDTFSVDVKRETTQSNNNPEFYLLSSVDGFTTADVLASTQLTTGGTFVELAADLDALGGFDGVAGATEFRIYVISPGSNQSGRRIALDNVTLDGALIPEPTSALLLLTALGFVATLRRRMGAGQEYRND